MLMKRILSSFVGFCLLFVLSYAAHAQAPSMATDFTLTDCDGTEHRLFEQLEAGNVVVIEFEMGCSPCVGGRKALAKIQEAFQATHPDRLLVYTMGFSANLSCTAVQNWMSSNDIFGPAFAGKEEVITSYNANEGMPTIVVLGGTDHKILYWRGAFSNKDTTAIKNAIAQVLTSASVSADNSVEQIQVFPNPATSSATVSMVCQKQSNVTVSLHNAMGIQLLPVHQGMLVKGEHSFSIMTDKLANGTYYLNVVRDGIRRVVPLTVTH
jgi:hypothetical protein